MGGRLRVWLHEGHDGPGVTALGLDHLGFSTWAESEARVLAKAPARFAEYAAWRARHGVPLEDPAAGAVEVAGRLEGGEILFPPDREPARPEEIDLTLRLLACTRADLLAELDAAPEAAFDWDPPYRRFAPWADWRTIRANLAHLAHGETHYYTRCIGHTPKRAPASPRGDWRVFLAESRAEAVAFLEALRASPDRARVAAIDLGFGEEHWSVRKALRRMVAHERLHTKSIARIVREHRSRLPGAAPPTRP